MRPLYHLLFWIATVNYILFPAEKYISTAEQCCSAAKYRHRMAPVHFGNGAPVPGGNVYVYRSFKYRYLIKQYLLSA